LRSPLAIKWVADQLGHSTPVLTLCTYAHAMPEEEADLAFFGLQLSKRERCAGLALDQMESQASLSVLSVADA
jgi:hypothetical protein